MLDILTILASLVILALLDRRMAGKQAVLAIPAIIAILALLPIPTLFAIPAICPAS